jgi:circadian clock protein KaiB
MRNVGYARRGVRQAGRMIMTQRGELRLYVTGSTLLSARAIENVEWMIREELGQAYDCEIVDVLERPDLAEEDHVFATPALVRRSPAPVRKLIGDLSDRRMVLANLRLSPQVDGVNRELIGE